MLLNRLKYWRELRGYSVRELAARSGIDASSISLLENLKRSPHGKTARTLAEALDVELADLYRESEPGELEISTALVTQPGINANKTQTAIKPARPTRSKAKPVISFWVIEKDQEEADPFKVSTQEEAERLKDRLGGQHQARIYEAASKFEAWELHRQFLIRVARGHDAW